MTTLTEAAYFSKKTILTVGIAITSILVLFVLWRTGNSILNSIIPSNQVFASVSFGKIPKLDLGEGIVPEKGIEYSLETISGDLPKLTTTLKVFEVKEPLPGFANLDDAKKIAEKAEFLNQPTSVSGGLASFFDKTGSKTMRVELASQNFAIQSDYLHNQLIITSKPSSDNTELEEAKKLFRAIGLSRADFPDDKTATHNLKIDGGRLVEALSVSSANLVQVAFSRADIDKIPVYSLDSKNPKVWVLATGKNIVAAQWSLWNVQKHKFATYPLKGVSKAYEELQAGKGVMNKSIETNVLPIRDISLGYLETKTLQKYLQPVYVFRSDEGLLIFISAVDDKWLQ